ncbi:MAG: F0F1 ATP synthase subunit delta [Synechococcales cyanobacterium K44_A2020_017]|nr:F0F1 ATP synthase subunit delta [Synechococcales cyanobacterium K32_A2020_035]MBF2094374.1 F0F1 ATP synthase subunit delta [Synechococcales cyanobacterium K44_A2020_017]
MNDSLVTAEILEPYAQALMSLAQGNDLVDPLSGDAAGLLELLKESPDLGQFLSSPIVGIDQKKAVLRQALTDQVHPYMMNFLLLLVDRRRISFIEGICRKYQSLVRELKKTVLAEVTSAVPLSESQQDAVRAQVLSLTGAQQVELELSQNPDLIGGVVIRVGSQVIDASLSGQLRRIGLKLSVIS